MNNISFVSFIVLIIIVYLCIHSLVDRICTCIERTAAFKCEGKANNNTEIKQTEEPQESEQ